MCGSQLQDSIFPTVSTICLVSRDLLIPKYLDPKNKHHKNRKTLPWERHICCQMCQIALSKSTEKVYFSFFLIVETAVTVVKNITQPFQKNQGTPHFLFFFFQPSHYFWKERFDTFDNRAVQRFAIFGCFFFRDCMICLIYIYIYSFFSDCIFFCVWRVYIVFLWKKNNRGCVNLFVETFCYFLSSFFLRVCMILLKKIELKSPKHKKT